MVVFDPRGPVNNRLALFGPVGEPMKKHINGLGPFDPGLPVGEANCCCVVDHDGRGGLRVAHLLTRRADGTAVTGSFKRGSDFGLHDGA